MKKNYFMLVAAAALFAACAETDLVNEEVVVQSNAPQAIGFEDFVGKATRHSGASTMNTYHETFGVFGYNDVDRLFMENYKVAYNTTSTPYWEYNGLQGGSDGTTSQTTKYWNKNTSYDFYAYAPYNKEVTITDGKFNIPEGNYAATENLQQEFTGNKYSTTLNNKCFSANTDWMLATAKENYTYTSGTTVPLSFSHMLSKFVVIVKTSGDDDVVITELSVTGGTYKTGSYDGTKWTATNETKLTGAVGTLATKDAKYYSMEYLLIPTETADPKLSITYQVNGQTYTETGLDIVNITEFAPGTYYTLTVSVGLEAIEFSATATPWTENTKGSVSIE